MTYLNTATRSALSGPRRPIVGSRPSLAAVELAALVHIVDVNESEQGRMRGWLAGAGFESRSYVHLGAFLSGHHTDRPGCLIIDAQPTAILGYEPQVILLPLAIRCPIVVMTPPQESQLAKWGGPKPSSIGILEKPLREQEVILAVNAALELDRQQRVMASREAELRTRFASLTARERQTMSLVVRGALNKQIAIDLGVCEATVKVHRGAAMRKMRAGSLADLVRMSDAVGEFLPAGVRTGGSMLVQSAAAADHRSRYSSVR